jgi:hypothetical protein
MRNILMIVAALMAVSACDKIKSARNKVLFDGHKFVAKLSVGDTRDTFVVMVQNAGVSLAGAREAGRYEATKYCLKNFGTSDVAWEHGPNAPDGALVIVETSLQLNGRCTG